MKTKVNRGFINYFLIILVVIALVAGIAVYLRSKVSPPVSVPIVTPAPSPTPTPTSTSTPMPTPTPTLKPTASATAAPAPKLPAYTGSVGTGYSTLSVNTEKGVFTAYILSVDLGSAKVATDTANDSDCANNCPVLSLASFVARNGGYAGVNGAYFCPAAYPECAGKTNSFDFPVYNTRLGKWINAGNLSWNGRAMFYVDGGGAHYLQNANSFGGGLTAGIVNYPGLVDNGNVQIDDNQSGLSDKQKAVGTKVGIGVKNSNSVMVVIASNVNMQQFAYVFKALGAMGALNLDTGGSTALYYNGGYLFGPGRDLTNAIIFVRK